MKKGELPGLHPEMGIRKPIKVRLGEDFSIQSALSGLEEVEGNKVHNIIEGYLLDLVPVDIEDVGIGRIDIVEVPTAFDDVNLPVCSPLGSVMPITLAAKLYSLQKENIKSVKFAILIGVNRIESVPRVDEIQLEVEGKGELYFEDWIDPKSGQRSQLALPPNPELFNPENPERIRFLFYKIK